MATRVLVTGGAGYIGSVLVPQLLANGYAVTVLDNFRYSQATLIDSCANPDFAIVRGDARDGAVLRRLMADADVIIPLAALVGAPLCNSDETAATTTNLGAIRTLLSMRSPNQRILFPCTNSGYGIGGHDSFCTEESPLRPISLYGTTKVQAESEILDAGNSISFRLATVFGGSPRMRLDLLVNDFVYRAVNDRFVVVFEGHFRRNYIHIRDVARAFLHGLVNFESMKNRPYNVGLSDANLSKLELCAEIKKQVPEFVYLEAPIGQDPDKRDYIVSNARIEGTGYRPEVTLADGIRELIKCYTIVRDRQFANA